MPDLTLVHEFQTDGAEDVEQGLQVWAQLIVRHLRQQGAPALAPGEQNGGRPT